MGLQAVKEVMCGRVDFDALCVDEGELGLPPVDDDVAVCVVGGVGGAEDVVWCRTDLLVEFGADGEGCVGHGTACGGTGYNCVDGYVCGTEGKAVQRPWEGYV